MTPYPKLEFLGFIRYPENTPFWVQPQAITAFEPSKEQGNCTELFIGDMMVCVQMDTATIVRKLNPQ